jgi:S1-C subfamily serine protease
MKKNNLHRLTITRLTLLILLALALARFSSSSPALAAGPTSTQEPASLSPTDIFALVSPSIAFIQTPRGHGSGVLIMDGYVVTNAHVVWPYREVRVVFPDGSEHLKAPVLNWDLLSDLAVIGPLQTSITPATLGDGEDLNIGSDVYLIGYPGAAEEFPQPTLTRGLISRLREWAAIEMTYFQTDAIVAGGQSGGVLVSQTGEVIGISGFAFTESRYGLVACVADIRPRIEGLIAGEDVAGLGERQMALEGGQLEHDVSLENKWDTQMYLIDEPQGTFVDIKLEGEPQAGFVLLDAFGSVVHLEDAEASRLKTGSVTTRLDLPYFVIVFQNTDDPKTFQVRSNHPLIPYQDGDDGIKLNAGQTHQASIDYPNDIDYYLIDLAEGDMIDIGVDSILINPMLAVDFKGATKAMMIEDDNSGGGLFGLNAAITYRASYTGAYLIIVESAASSDTGGYILTVTEASPDATPTTPLIQQPEATVIIPSLRIRSGPGTDYESQGAVQKGETLPVVGQAYDCQWLQIETAEGDVGWMSGAPEYVTLSQPCESIPQAEIPPLPKPAQPAPASNPTPASADLTAGPLEITWSEQMTYEGRVGESRWCQINMVYTNKSGEAYLWPDYQAVFFIFNADGSPLYSAPGNYYSKAAGWPNGIEGIPPDILSGTSADWTWYSATQQAGQFCGAVGVAFQGWAYLAFYDQEGRLLGTEVIPPE